MTESENIDSTQSTENVTVTSDAAFERVTSDIKMEEWEDSWFLKQNTAWLVQEVPNISILDISDFLIENKKTLYDRQNWNVVIWKAGRSIEAQPQDFCFIYWVDHDTNYSWEQHWIPITSSSLMPKNSICFEIKNVWWVTYVEIKEPWYYELEYEWTIHSSTVTNWANNYLEHWFWIMPDMTAYNTQISSIWYRYYDTIHNKVIRYCDVWDQIWIYLNRTTWTYQIYNIYFEVKYLFNSIN